MKNEAVKLGAVLDKTNISSGKCENCGYRPRWRYGNEIKKWCYRCIQVWERKQGLTEYQVERTICKIVEPLYLDAKMSDLSVELQGGLEKIGIGQDIFFHGPIGTGKTHAMAALVRKYVYEGYECERINFDDFCVKVRSAMSPVSTLTEWDMIEPLKNIDILFIDDLGLRSKQETDFAYVTFYSILNKRQERRLSTVVSSNKDIKHLATAFDSRIASRLSTALIIEMSGKDRRASVAKQKAKE